MEGKTLQLFGLGDTSTLLTVGLRKLGVDCDLLLSNRAFVTQYPAWTKKYPILKDGCYHWDKSDGYNPRTVADLYKFVRKYDLIFAHPPAGAYAWHFGKPFVLWDGGSGNFILDKKYQPKKDVDRMKHAPVRLSYKKAKHIFFNDINVIYTAWQKMSWKHDRYCYIPLPVDTEVFKPMQIKKPKQFIAYLPTRQEVLIKGVKEILQGFKQFTKYVPDAQLWITRYGSDLPVTEYLIEELELKDNIAWVPLVPKPEFAKMINYVDVVIDQVKLGAIGGVTVQALSCGQRVIVNANEEWYKEQLGEVPPVYHAYDKDTVFSRLLECYYSVYMNKYVESFINDRARRFVLKHFDYMKVAEKVLALIHPYI